MGVEGQMRGAGSVNGLDAVGGNRISLIQLPEATLLRAKKGPCEMLTFP
jgi:hypothetical protein